MKLFQKLNEMPVEEALLFFLTICASRRWASVLTAHRPYLNLLVLLHNAKTVWFSLPERDRLEAFSAHPKIGDLTVKGSSAKEQAAVLTADAEILSQLAQLNTEYFDRFGFIFIIFASGKTPQEILDHLTRRLKNSRETELENATREQSFIILSRLEKAL